MSWDIKALVIKCSKLQLEQNRIFSYLRIKARMVKASAIVLAVEDAGTYEFFLLRDVYYFRNIPNNGKTDRPYTIQWSEKPEALTFAQMPGTVRNEITEYLNSDSGLDAGYGFASLDSHFSVQMPHCQRFYTDPESAKPKSGVAKFPRVTNPFLRNATVNEITKELVRRGYDVQVSLKSENTES